MSVCVSVCVLCWHCRMETRATLQATPHFVCRNSAMHKLRTPGACVRDSRDLFACREECVWCRHTRSGGEGARCKWAARAQKIRCLSPPSVVSLAEWTNELDISRVTPTASKISCGPTHNPKSHAPRALSPSAHRPLFTPPLPPVPPPLPQSSYCLTLPSSISHPRSPAPPHVRAQTCGH